MEQPRTTTERLIISRAFDLTAVFRYTFLAHDCGCVIKSARFAGGTDIKSDLIRNRAISARALSSVSSARIKSGAESRAPKLQRINLNDELIHDSLFCGIRRVDRDRSANHRA